MTSPASPDSPSLEEPLPPHITFQARDGVIELTQRRSIGWSLAFLPIASFSCCCFGFGGFFGAGLVDGTVRQVDGNNNLVRYWKVPWLGYLVTCGSVLLMVLVLYRFLISLVNRVKVRVEPGRFRLLHRPLPWPPGNMDVGPEDLRLETINGLRVTQGQRDVVTPTFILIAIDRRGWRHQLVSGLKSQAQGEWIAAEIRRVMAQGPAHR